MAMPVVPSAYGSDHRCRWGYVPTRSPIELRRTNRWQTGDYFTWCVCRAGAAIDLNMTDLAAEHSTSHRPRWAAGPKLRQFPSARAATRRLQILSPGRMMAVRDQMHASIEPVGRRTPVT